MIEIYAGKNAIKQIEQYGFSSDLFGSFLGASGGPKWFTLYGLDRYCFGQFFKHRTQPLNIIGSSAGAYRGSCFGQQNPLAALERMVTSYSETVYSKNAKPEEITTKAKAVLDYSFGKQGVTEVINNPIFKAHFIVSKCNGMVSSENQSKQSLGLARSYVYNRLGRHKLAKQFERYIFGPKNSNLAIDDNYQIPTRHITFTEDNLVDSVLASGSIPLVMQGIKDISGCPRGMYRDGGIIDYHFDFKIRDKGLTFYPHFSASPKAGWFDKSLPRKVSTENYANTVMICPSQAFIDSLPYGKIPDRTDFTTMEAKERISYWKQALVQTEQLADAFDHFCHHQNLNEIKVFKQ